MAQAAFVFLEALQESRIFMRTKRGSPFPPSLPSICCERKKTEINWSALCPSQQLFPEGAVGRGELVPEGLRNCLWRSELERLHRKVQTTASRPTSCPARRTQSFLRSHGPASFGVCGRREALFWRAGAEGRPEEGYSVRLPAGVLAWWWPHPLVTPQAPCDDTHLCAQSPTVPL